jgi:hypothetical protein
VWIRRGTDHNTRAGQDVLRAAIERRGLPQQLHSDNGAPFANAALERSCAVLGIRLIHKVAVQTTRSRKVDDVAIPGPIRKPTPAGWAGTGRISNGVVAGECW